MVGFACSQSPVGLKTALGPREKFIFENTIPTATGEKKEVFFKIVKRMIEWEQEERSNARELLNDPWLHMNYPTA